MLEQFFKSQVAAVSDPYQCNRITDALAALHLHTSPENLQTVTLTWRSVVLVICDMPSTTQPSTSATGIPSLLNILPRNVLKESTTMLPYPMPRRNLCG